MAHCLEPDLVSGALRGPAAGVPFLPDAEALRGGPDGGSGESVVRSPANAAMSRQEQKFAAAIKKHRVGPIADRQRPGSGIAVVHLSAKDLFQIQVKLAARLRVHHGR